MRAFSYLSHGTLMALGSLVKGIKPNWVAAGDCEEGIEKIAIRPSGAPHSAILITPSEPQPTEVN